MSKADILFKNMCRDILNHGVSNQGEPVRPHWEDGTPAYTKKLFGIVNRYHLAEEFPAITLRKTYIKSAAEEILWIWQKKSNDVRKLKTRIWDEWADKNGRIGKAYGYQQANMYEYRGITEEGLYKAFPNLETGRLPDHRIGYGYQVIRDYYTAGSDRINHPIAIPRGNGFCMTQLDKAIYDLINHPSSRRILVTMWNPEDLKDMALEPCAWSMTFNVTGHTLNAILNQRSQDVLAANNWNVVQYAILLMMIAQVTGYEAGELVHVIADSHIYDRHVPIIKEMLQREPLPAPKVTLNPAIKNFYDFTTDDIRIDHYETHPQFTNIPIAI